MSTDVIRRISPAKASIVVFVVVAIVTAIFMVRMSQGVAAPTDPTDQTKVPHYFGPYPNWALSPLTTPDATVTIDGDGTGATATATVGGNGAITGITITDPGTGYSAATVTIGGAGAGATADAVVTASGTVTAVTVDLAGAGYTKPTVTISGGGATTDATATAYGGVDVVNLVDPGTGYTFPTVDFDMPDDPNGTQAKAHADFDATTGAITAIVVDDPGSGYAAAPNVVVRDGTLMDPINNAGAGATATATLAVQTVTLDTFGSGYTSAPTVTITDATGTGTGATATAAMDRGGVTAVNVTAAGSGYVTAGGIRKFVDDLPGLCVPPGCPTAADAKYIPVGVPEAKTYPDAKGNLIAADQYEIALVQYRTKFSSDLPATLVRGYVQLETPANQAVSQHFPLTNELMDGTKVPVTIDGVQALAVTPPQWLGPVIGATKDKPVRIVFRNLLPTGNDGDLFLPTDSTMMGSGMGPMAMADPVNGGSVLDEVRNPICSEANKGTNMGCFADNRATLHLHGGITPWISDGTAHQWITPAGQMTDWPQGVSVQAVPDMTDVDTGPRDGVETFYYTNQQSARLMFYHDHAWGITRLNVYAGEAAGYTITDDTEKALVSSGTIPAAADTIPLIVQDRTFVPAKTQLDQQDPTWDVNRWGAQGSLWYHHVYMPAQNPGDPSGMSAYGRWMYGPWFWPPAADTKFGPIDNPYYDPACKLDDPGTWQYQTDPFCEPKQIPGTPNISVGMEQFNDTPIVNGVAYPKVTLEPKTYRLRMLNAANDRFFNFQWYVADPSQGDGTTEVALKPAELAAAQTDPVVFPTPVDANNDAAGPDWIQIGSEGGFLPAPTVVDGQQPTTWITDPTRFDVGNVDKHSLLLAPAERADVIVDFSKYAGKTLILYNDAPAAFPARVPSYDYYTGQPDLSPNGAPGVLPGYGPNTRTVMKVTIAANAPATAFNMTALRNAFSHKANGSGVFEKGQHPIIVGQSAYNSAYGTTFQSSSNCNAPGTALQDCDGLVRVNDTTTFGFNTLKAPKSKMSIPLQPKAIHDEMNASTFDEFGRMTANLGVEAQPPTPGAQNVTLYPFVNPATELIDGTNLPKQAIVYDVDGNAVSDVKISPISDAGDGTQIWRITHNGVDTHPIHFHLYDVQVLNRVTWDNIIIPTEASELGWKDTVRMSPLEDTIVALRPVVPDVPFEVPNAIRPLNPMMPLGSTAMFNNVDPKGNPTTAVTNQLVNFGWEYVYHCHILSHEEMDMMRPVSMALPPNTPDGLAFTANGNQLELSWNDNSITETAFVVQRTADGTNWADIGTILSPLDASNTHGFPTFTDLTYDPGTVYQYRVVAQNKVGYGKEFPTVTAQSVSEAVTTGSAPLAPTDLTATAQAGPQVALGFTDNATDETGFTLQRADNGGAWATIATLPANGPVTTGAVSYTDTGVTAGNSYAYRVRAIKGAAASAWSNTATVAIPAVPATPTGLTATLQAGPQGLLAWTDNATNEDSYVVERAPTGTTTFQVVATLGADATTWTDTTVVIGTTYDYRVAAVNAISGSSAYSNIATLAVPTIPAAPSALTGVVQAGPQIALTWTDNANNEAGFTLERSVNGGAFAALAAVAADTTTYIDTNVTAGATYAYQIRSFNLSGVSAWTGTTVAVPTLPAAPSLLTRTTTRTAAGPDTVVLTWVDNASNEASFTIQRATDSTFTAGLTTFTVGPNVVTFTNTITHGQTYYYRVQAVNVIGVSTWSNTVNVTTVPATPTNFRSTGRTRTSITLAWNDVSANESGYQLQRRRVGANNWTTMVTTAANATTYTTTGRSPGTAYDFRIRGVNGVGQSPWSAVIRVSTLR